jgi:hypothetical protein
VPEDLLDPDQEADVRRVVGHLLDGASDEILDGLEAAGWWDMWARSPAATSQLFFASEGSRGTCSPALAGFALRLLGVGAVSAKDGMVFGTGTSGTAGAQEGRGAATIRGIVVGGRSGGLLAVVRGSNREVLVRFSSPEYITIHDDGWASPFRFASGSGPAEEIVGGGERWAQTWRFVRRAWATQLLAMSEAHLAAACDHCRDRQQFGRSIASFQAVKHHLARVKVAIEAARPVVRASWEHDSEFQTIAAKALAGAAYLEAHNRGIHVMGGMGYSREHPIGRYHSTGLALEALGGSTRANSQALASVARASPSTLRSPVVP